MAINRRNNTVNQLRIDTPYLRSIESAVCNDFDSVSTNLLTGEGKSYIVRGFEINMIGAISSAASGLQLLVANSSLLHGNSSVSGTFFNVPAGTPSEVLNSNVNTKVIGSFVANTVNYIGIEFNRSVDSSTSGQVYLWNPSTKTEISKTLPLAETLSYNIIITSSIWASNVLPISIVTTNSSNNVVSISDNRPMYLRLGTAGSSNPNPFYDYKWDNQAEGRVENPYSSTSEVSPFRGGDKQILSLKEWMDAAMSVFKEIKGTTYWYSENTGGSIISLREDLANTVISGRGNIVHDPVLSGQINWSDDIHLNFIGGKLRYKILANPSSNYITLADDKVAYLNLVRNQPVIPNLIFTQLSTAVTSVGHVSWTTDLQAGDFIRSAYADTTYYYEILSVDSSFQVTLKTSYSEVSTGINGTQALYTWGVYQAASTPTTNRHIQIADRKSIPFGQDNYWFLLREDDTGSLPKVYIRFTETELQQGESIQINDNTSLNVLSYIGSASESANNPIYSNISSGAITASYNYGGTQGQDLTVRTSILTSMMADKAQDKTLKYAENYNSINNITSGANQQLTFIGVGTPTLGVILPSSTNFNNIITLTGTLSLQVNQAAYFTIDRNAGFSIANLSALTICNISAVPLAENVYIFAYRLSGVECYLYNNKKLKLGGNPLSSGAGVIKVKLNDPYSTTLTTGIPVTVDGVVVADQDRVLFTALTSNPNRIYSAVVSGGSVVSWNPEYDFGGFQDPSDGDFVVITSGTLFGDQLGKFTGTAFVFNDKVRYFNGADYFEQSSLFTSTILNNQSSAEDITTFNFSGSEYCILEYSIARGTARETGMLILSTDGIDVAFAQYGANLSSVGVVLSADISGTLLRVRYTSDSSGSAGTMKFHLRRWSNSAGGPSGVPSYTGGGGGGGGGGVTASGAPLNGEVAIFTGASDITGNANFKFDTVNSAINLNGLNIGALQGPYTLADNTPTETAVISYDYTLYPFSIIEYSLERNNERRVGRILLTHNGSITNLSDDYSPTSDLGVAFYSDLSGSDIRLKYTTTSTTFNATMKLSIRKWA